MATDETRSAATVARWWCELRWWLRCKRKGYPAEVYDTISPHAAPPAAVERLRQRVLDNDWGNHADG